MQRSETGSAEVIDAHITLCVLTKHCLICYGFSLSLFLSPSVSRPACLTLFIRLSSGLATCYAWWPMIKQCVMIQSQIHLRGAAGSCHPACFRNQISFQAPVRVRPSTPPLQSVHLVKCFQEAPRGVSSKGVKHGVSRLQIFFDFSILERQTAVKGNSEASFIIVGGKTKHLK